MKRTHIHLMFIGLTTLTHNTATMDYIHDQGCDHDDIEAMYEACREGDLARVQSLIEKDANLVHTDVGNREPPLNVVAFSARGEAKGVIRALLQAGAYINKSATFDNMTPLLVAAREKKEEVVSLLLLHGADPNAPYNSPHTWVEYYLGNRPIECAFEKESLMIAAQLVAAGARAHPLVQSIIRSEPRYFGPKIGVILGEADERCVRAWVDHLRGRLGEDICTNMVPGTQKKISEVLEVFVDQVTVFSDTLHNTVAEIRRLLVEQEVPPKRQVLAIIKLLALDGLLISNPQVLSYIQSFLPAEDILAVMGALPLGFATAGSALSVLP